MKMKKNMLMSQLTKALVLEPREHRHGHVSKLRVAFDSVENLLNSAAAAAATTPTSVMAASVYMTGV